MSKQAMEDVLDFEEEFDPLAVDDLEIDQEDMDDDNPLDTVDYPTMRNMPESMHRAGVYTPETQGSVRQAVLFSCTSSKCAGKRALRQALLPRPLTSCRRTIARCTRQ